MIRNLIILAVCLLLAIFCGLSYGHEVIQVTIMLFFAGFGVVSLVTLIVKGIRDLVKARKAPDVADKAAAEELSEGK